MRSFFLVSGAVVFVLAISAIVVRPTSGQATASRPVQKWEYATIMESSSRIDFLYSGKSYSESGDDDLLKLAKDLGMTTERFDPNTAAETEILDLLGQQGWELAAKTSLRDGDSSDDMFYFKRQTN